MKEVTKIQVKGSEFISKSDYDKLLSDYQDIKHQLKELKRLIFGRKSERHIAQQEDGQLSLFEQQETKADKDDVKGEINYTRTKTKKDKERQ